MKAKSIKRSVKLRLISGKSGLEMMKELGYKATTDQNGLTVFRNGDSRIVIWPGDLVRFHHNGWPCAAEYTEILALARMIEEGTL